MNTIFLWNVSQMAVLREIDSSGIFSAISFSFKRRRRLWPTFCFCVHRVHSEKGVCFKRTEFATQEKFFFFFFSSTIFAELPHMQVYPFLFSRLKTTNGWESEYITCQLSNCMCRVFHNICFESQHVLRMTSFSEMTAPNQCLKFLTTETHVSILAAPISLLIAAFKFISSSC